MIKLQPLERNINEHKPQNSTKLLSKKIKRMREWKNRIPVLHGAFTLIEMLIVVTIIGILSAAIIPRMTGYMERTRDLKRKLDLQQIATAMQLYYDQHGTWPQKNKEYQEKMRKKHS